MALETLREITEIDGFRVWEANTEEVENPPMPPCTSGEIPIVVDQARNEIKFKIQNGPIKEGNGVNGCQVDTLIQAASMIITAFDEKFPCSENGVAIDALRIASNALKMRRERREREGNEGFSREKGDA